MVCFSSHGSPSHNVMTANCSSYVGPLGGMHIKGIPGSAGLTSLLINVLFLLLCFLCVETGRNPESWSFNAILLFFQASGHLSLMAFQSTTCVLMIISP